MQPKNTETQILAADDARLQAVCRADTTALTAMLDEGFVYIHRNGEMDTKAQYLDRMGGGNIAYSRPRRDRVEFRHHAGFVVMTGRLLIDVEVLRPQKRSLELDNVFLSVWKPAGGEWRMAAWASIANSMP